MIDFSILKALTIPEGDVKRIDINGVKQWEVDVRDLYQRVESITTKGGTSGGWFLTDFIANNQSGLELTYSVPSFSDASIMGSRTSSSNTRLYVIYPMTSSRGYFGWNTAVSINCSIAANAIHTTRLNWLNERKAVLMSADGTVELTKSFTATLVQQVSPVAICRYNNATNTPGGGRAMTVYGARLSQGTEIVREYIPCYRKSDGEIGLFETLTETFLPSQVANGFTCGPEIDW